MTKAVRPVFWGILIVQCVGERSYRGYIWLARDVVLRASLTLRVHYCNQIREKLAIILKWVNDVLPF